MSRREIESGAQAGPESVFAEYLLEYLDGFVAGAVSCPDPFDAEIVPHRASQIRHVLPVVGEKVEAPEAAEEASKE